MRIGDYECISPFVTAGSGNARWCIAEKDGKRYFLKQFLAPVQPVQTTQMPPELLIQRRARCAAFERRKLALYDALKKLGADCVVCMDDFFVYDGHYFTASEYIDPSYRTFESIRTIHPRTVSRLLHELSVCLRMLHACGVVHADLKPEHIVVGYNGETPRVRLIDFDAGFLEAYPPDTQTNIEVDPVYLSPEAYRLISGNPVRLDHRLDTFAFGILIHQALTGETPGFDRSVYAYLYACVLDGGRVTLSRQLHAKQRALIRGMLKRNPAQRPGDQAVCKALRVAE